MLLANQKENIQKERNNMYLINANSGKELFPDRRSLNNKGNKPIITRGGKYREWNGKEYESTNSYSVDLVMQAVDFYRVRALQGGKPLKRIILSNANYDRFDDFMRLNYMKDKQYEELCDEDNIHRKYQVDGVPIDRAGLLNVKEIDFEFYPTMAEAMSQPRDVKAYEEPKSNILEGTNVDSKVLRGDANPEKWR